MIGQDVGKPAQDGQPEPANKNVGQRSGGEDRTRGADADEHRGEPENPPENPDHDRRKR